MYRLLTPVAVPLGLAMGCGMAQGSVTLVAAIVLAVPAPEIATLQVGFSHVMQVIIHREVRLLPTAGA